MPRKPPSKSAKPAPAASSAPAAAPARRAHLAPARFIARGEMTQPHPISGWGFNDIQAALDAHSSGQFSQSELLYHAARRIDRIYGGLESRCNAVRAYPFTLTVPAGAPDALKARAAELEASWPALVLSEADRSEVVERVVMMGFCIARVQWLYVDGQQAPKLTSWTHSNCWYDVVRRCYVVHDESGQPVYIPHDGDGKEWVVFSQGGSRPWLKGAILPLGRCLAYLALTTDQWSRYNDAEGLAIKGVKTPEIKRESEEARKLWDVVGELVGGDNVLLPEGFDLKLITSAARGSAFKTFEVFHHILQAGVAIVLLGHASAQESVNGAGTYGSTAAALSVAADRSISDVSVLAAALAPLMRTWVKVNFTAALYKTPRPLAAYAPLPRWNTKPPEDQAATAETRQKNANAVKALSDAAGGITVLVAAGLDLAGVLRMCGMPMIAPGQIVPALPVPSISSKSEETN